MGPKLTCEQRQAIDDHEGQPVSVVDTKRRDSFALPSPVLVNDLAVCFLLKDEAGVALFRDLLDSMAPMA